MDTHPLVILGSGPAGCTAALYAARAGLAPLVLEGPLPGGQLTQTSDVENFPGFPRAVGGYDLVVAMREQAERFGARFEADAVTACDLAGETKTLTTLTGGTLRCRALIVATGASARWLGVPGEEALRGRGVSACATCDGAFFRGRHVAVVGGGDVACEDALTLSKLCAKVTLIHRRDSLRASKVLADRVLAAPNVEPLWDTVVEAVRDPAQGRVTALALRGVKTGAAAELPVDGLFVAIGHAPNTDFLRGALPLDPAGYVLGEDVRTAVPGVFAAGDVMDPRYKQAVVAASAGARAALEAERFLR